MKRLKDIAPGIAHQDVDSPKLFVALAYETFLICQFEYISHDTDDIATSAQRDDISLCLFNLALCPSSHTNVSPCSRHCDGDLPTDAPA
jgi:hypothetical protein